MKRRMMEKKLVRVVPWEEAPPRYYSAPCIDILSIILTLLVREFISRGILASDNPNISMIFHNPCRFSLVIEHESNDRKLRYNIDVEGRGYVSLVRDDVYDPERYVIIKMDISVIDYAPYRPTKTISKIFTIIFPKDAPLSEIEEALRYPVHEYLSQALK